MNSTSEAKARRLDVEFLYLDLSVCTRCQGTENSLDEAVSEVARVLELSGTGVNVRKIHVQSEEQARELGFISSPTIRINSRDIQQAKGATMDVKESPCQCGGSLCGETVYCRDWVYQGKEYATPPMGLIVDAILREVYGYAETALVGTRPIADVPDSLKRFFAAREERAAETQNSACCGTASSKSCC